MNASAFRRAPFALPTTSGFKTGRSGRRAESWGIPVHIGILAGFGGRTTPMTKLHRKLQLAHQRGFGAVYFYWEGLWGTYAGPEGGDFRRQGLRRRHAELFGEQILPF